MKRLLSIAMMLSTLTACNMFTAWRTIPAPGGCADCHTVPISANWNLAYRPVTLNDERGGQSFQQPGSLQPNSQKPVLPAETHKVEQLPCFDCHNSPDAAHKLMKGDFHH